MMRTGARFATLGAAVAMLLASPAGLRAAETKQEHAAATTPSSPTAFIKEAGAGGMAEVKLGNLAIERASSDDVKNFAKRMVDDHTKINNDLQKVAQKKNVTLPTELNAKDQALYDRLSKLSGKEFDRAYMEAMLTDHRADVAAFQRETKSGDADVRDFATRSLPTLEQHLASAEQIDRVVAGNEPATSTAGTGMHRATHP